MPDSEEDSATTHAEQQPPHTSGEASEPKQDAPAESPDSDGKTDQDGGPQPDGDHNEPVQSAAELGASASTRRRLRKAGQDSLGGTWFEAAARFSGPASFGSGQAVGGNVSTAGRDVNTYYFGGSAERHNNPDTGPIAPALLAGIRETYVPGDSYAAAERVLRASRIVIIRGAGGTGKRTSALRLLAELADDDVHELGVSVVLGSPRDVELREGAGYLAEGEAGSVFAYHRMAAWAASLSELNAYLIITVPSSASVGTNVADYFLIEHIPPDRRAVARSHLGAGLMHTDERDRLLERADVQRHLACVVSPGSAAALASTLAFVRGEDIEQDLATFAHVLHRNQARRMLGTERPAAQRDRVDLLYRRAGIIAIGVFAELPYTEAMAAAETLAKAFITLEFPLLSGHGRELFIRWPDILVSEPGISIEETELPIRWGTTAVRHVRFVDPHLHGAVLEEIWEHYDPVRSPLLDWLADLALRAPDEAVRVRAAQVIGRYAIRDFGHVCHRQIAEWASSVNERHREAAATALEAAAAGRYEDVLDLINHWCDGGNQHRQRTAIIALGTRIGDQDPRQTLNQLRRLTQRGSGNSGRSVAEAVRRSLIDLMSGPHLQHVVDALAQWVGDDKDARLSSLARRCVPTLAHVSDNDQHPAFLTALATTPSLRTAAVLLFTKALSDSETKHETWDALERLAVEAAQEPGQINVLGDLLHGLSLQSPIGSGQIIFYLRLWALRNEELLTATGAARADAPTGVEG